MSLKLPGLKYVEYIVNNITSSLEANDMPKFSRRDFYVHFRRIFKNSPVQSILTETGSFSIFQFLDSKIINGGFYVRMTASQNVWQSL